MPINYADYPPEFGEIKKQVWARDGGRCVTCGIEHESIRQDSDGNDLYTEYLAVAHLDDSEPTNCDMGNLGLFCMQHHPRLDWPMHGRNAAATRERRRRCYLVEKSLQQCRILTSPEIRGCIFRQFDLTNVTALKSC